MRRSTPRWLGTTALVQALSALGLCFVPLFNLLAYEFCLAIGLVTALTAPVVGLSVASSDGRTGRAWLQAWALAWLQLLPGLLCICLNALRVQNCNLGQGLLWFLLLPASNALVGVSLGVAVARLAEPQRGWSRRLLLLICMGLPLLASLRSLYQEAPIFVFDHLWGYFAGSLYDEYIPIDARIWLFRGGSLVRAGALLALATAWSRWAQLGTAQVGATALLALGATLLYDAQVGPAAGYAGGQARIEAALPVRLHRPGLVLHLPEGLSSAQQEALADDHAFRLDQLREALAVQLRFDVHSYVYPNAQTKAALMGGRGTMVAKPWLHQIHIHGTQVPHPLVAHELAHAVAASFGSQLLGVSARWGLLVNMGLVEGLATALAPDVEALGLHSMAQAMLAQGLAPDLVQLMGPAGFWRQAPARAYGLAGSFVRHLLQEHGATPLKAAYPRGDFTAAYGVPLETLVARWRHFLASVPVPIAEQHRAVERFRRPSIFVRACAHEVADLSRRASQVGPQEAVALRQQICAHLGPEAIEPQLDLLQDLSRAQRLPAALALGARLQAQAGLNTAQSLRLRLLQAALFWREARYDEAEGALQAALRLPIDSAGARAVAMRLWAMQRPNGAAAPLVAYLQGELEPLSAQIWLQREAARAPQDPSPPYLMGRQLHAAGAWALALAQLTAVAPHSVPAVEHERLRLVADCAWQLRDWDRAADAFSAWGRAAPSSGAAAAAADWRARVAWQRRQPKNASAAQPAG